MWRPPVENVERDTSVLYQLFSDPQSLLSLSCFSALIQPSPASGFSNNDKPQVWFRAHSQTSAVHWPQSHVLRTKHGKVMETRRLEKNKAKEIKAQVKKLHFDRSYCCFVFSANPQIQICSVWGKRAFNMLNFSSGAGFLLGRFFPKEAHGLSI